MENNKKGYSEKDLPVHNNISLTADSGNKLANEEIDKKKVNFHSDFINETAGQLDITV